MKKKFFFFLILSACVLLQATAQRTDIKYYPAKTFAGEVYVISTYGEMFSGFADKVYNITANRENNYYFNSLSSARVSDKFEVYIDRVYFTTLKASSNGWQFLGSSKSILLTKGNHEIRIKGINTMVPMVEELFITLSSGWFRTTSGTTNGSIEDMSSLSGQPASTLSVSEATGNFLAKTLPNPQGTYNHAIDTSFSYTHFSTIYLTAGSHTFATSGSTINRALTIFNPSNFTYSWSTTGGGPGGESSLALYVGLAGYYSIMLRPVTDAATGTTNILYNGDMLVSGASIGGRRIAMSSAKGGALNFFTCKLSAGDTRIIATRYEMSSARGYNDDYSTAGDWNWGLASRIKKDFGTDLVQYGFVCAYSPSSTGLCDIYLGNENSDVYAANFPEFPLLKPDDAIKSAPGSGVYNCISWSGGITSTWVWPPSQYSTYSCTSSAGDVSCFDNFYANSPVRYPGAWNYTRSGATVSNAVVDLWKLTPHYTHASVRKPGNDHPHGYDWESKPGSLTRTFHPRNALTNNSFGYGSVTNYYRPSGTYAKGAAKAFESDSAAVKAGVAVFEHALLTYGAAQKLRQLTSKIDNEFISRFQELYESWKKTWPENSIYSDPAMYSRNDAYRNLLSFSKTNSKAAMLLVFEKFVNENDHLIGDLMWALTEKPYGHLLQEVKTERLANPNNKDGLYKIHGDHDNGVLYVEKILKDFTYDEVIKTNEESSIQVILMPNPVRENLTVKIILGKPGKILVKAMSAQTGRTQMILPETALAAGTYQYSTPVKNFAGGNGDMITVQVISAEGIKTLKALVIN